MLIVTTRPRANYANWMETLVVAQWSHSDTAESEVVGSIPAERHSGHCVLLGMWRKGSWGKKTEMCA